MLLAINLFALGMFNQEGAYPWWNYPGFELWKFVNLCVFILAGLYIHRVFGRPVSEGLRSRREMVRRDLVKAKEERDRALAKLAEVEARLELIDNEVKAIREHSEAEAQAERSRIIQATQTEMTKLREQAQREIESAGKAARHELRVFAAKRSISLAEEIIRRNIRPEDDVRLIDRSVQELGRGKH